MISSPWSVCLNSERGRVVRVLQRRRGGYERRTLESLSRLPSQSWGPKERLVHLTVTAQMSSREASNSVWMQIISKNERVNTPCCWAVQNRKDGFVFLLFTWLSQMGRFLIPDGDLGYFLHGLHNYQINCLNKHPHYEYVTIYPTSSNNLVPHPAIWVIKPQYITHDGGRKHRTG